MKKVIDIINESRKTLHIVIVNRKNAKTMNVKFMSVDKIKKLFGRSGIRFHKHYLDGKPSELSSSYNYIKRHKIADIDSSFVFDINLIANQPLKEFSQMGLFNKDQMHELYEIGIDNEFSSVDREYNSPLFVVNVKEFVDVMGEAWVNKHCDESPAKYLHMGNGVWIENTALNRWLMNK